MMDRHNLAEIRASTTTTTTATTATRTTNKNNHKKTNKKKGNLLRIITGSKNTKRHTKRATQRTMTITNQTITSIITDFNIIIILRKIIIGKQQKKEPVVYGATTCNQRKAGVFSHKSQVPHTAKERIGTTLGLAEGHRTSENVWRDDAPVVFFKSVNRYIRHKVGPKTSDKKGYVSIFIVYRSCYPRDICLHGHL